MFVWQFSLFLLFNSLLGLAQGQVFRESCPDVPALENMDRASLEGQWYEIRRTPNPWEFGRCTQLNQTVIDNVTYLMHWEEIIPGEDPYSYAVSHGTSQPEGHASDLTLRFIVPPLPFQTPFKIIATDYNNYFVSYTCSRYYFSQPSLADFVIFTEYVWIMSRRRHLDVAEVERLKGVLERLEIFVNWLQVVDHSNCDESYAQAQKKTKITADLDG